MQPLSAADIVQLWELGQGQHPLDRALTWLAFALPEVPMDTLAALSIGQRDAHLLLLRELTLGPQMDSQAICPQCQERLEFTLNTQDLRIIDLALPETVTYQWQHEAVQAQFRLPNSLDLAAILTIEEPNLARKTLIERCLLELSDGGQPLAIADLPEGVITPLAAQMAKADSQADITLDLACPACSHGWQVLFDIVAFFWGELAAQAQRQLMDVYQLARAYHWREQDILAMSSQRRQFYLSLVS